MTEQQITEFRPVDEAWCNYGRDRVYFVLAPSVGLVKIGTSWRLPHRLAELQAMSPVPLQLVGSVPGNAEVEARYHGAFAEHRSHGEWFRFDPTVEHRISLDCLTALWNATSPNVRKRFLAVVNSDTPTVGNAQ